MFTLTLGFIPFTLLPQPTDNSIPNIFRAEQCIMIVEIVVSLFVVWLTWSVVSSYMTRRKMPPGPFPFPFVGNFPQMLCDPVDPFSKLAEEYGDIYTLSFPTGNMVVLNTASLVREARLKKRGDLVGKSPDILYPLPVILGDDFGQQDYSPKYVLRKKIFLSALHQIESRINYKSSTERAVDAVKILLEQIESNEGKPFSPKEYLHASILAQLWKMLTTKKVSIDDPIVKSLLEFNEIFAKQAIKGTLYQMIPFGSYLPNQFNRDVKRAVKIRESILPAEFKAHLETFQLNLIRDLTDSFISLFKKEIPKHDCKDVGSIEAVPGLMLDVFAAGAETTSSSLAWFILYMVLHKNVQKRIHREIDNVLETDRNPEWEDIKDMPYLQAALCEVMRITKVVPFAATNAIRDTTIAGYPIPKGTLVALNLARVHHDEREWPEPDVYKPERFLDSEENFVGWTKLHGFMPFSVGKRECTGQSLARIMMLMFASTLLHRYEIVLPEGSERPTTKILEPALILHPQEFKVLTKKRF